MKSSQPAAFSVPVIISIPRASCFSVQVQKVQYQYMPYPQ